MKRALLFCYTCFLLAQATSPSQAQTKQGIIKDTDTQTLNRMAGELGRQYKTNRGRALELAPKKGWVIEQTYKDGTTVSLQGIDETGHPLYYVTQSNLRSATTTRTDQLWPGGSTGFGLTGASPAMAGKLGIWDGGRVRDTHQEFAGRVKQQDRPSDELDVHATHVAGTMIARGVNPLAKGMAFAAPDLQAFDFNNDIAEMAANAADGMLISNHSYGNLAGWQFNPDREGTATDPYWEWHGNVSVSTIEDVKFGYYSNQAREWDRITFNAPYYLPVKSAGNNRTMTGPEEGEPFWQFDASGARELVAGRPAGINSNNTYDVIPTYGNSKNILTIGAIDPIASGYNQASDVRITSFSSYGPTDDGRIKPDLVGNGLNVLSSSATSDDAYTILGGTSMAAPNVSGSLHLLQELYQRQNRGNFMRAATLKGLAIHTTDEAGPDPGPDYIFGWGLFNAERAARVIANSPATNLITERTLAQGQDYTFQVVASGSGPLAVTISWTDPEAEVISVAEALNNRTPRLVNDLDVRVTRGNTTYRPWQLDPLNPADPATKGDNILDNIENILIADAIPGETYTITVSHKGTLQRGPQAYSLLVSGIGGIAYCPSAPSSTADSKITRLTFGTIDYTAPAGCTGFSDLTSLSTGLQLGQAVPLSITLGTCGDIQNKIAKVFIDWNGDGDFNDPDELVATSEMIAGTETFNSTVNVPSTVGIGNITRMRVVLAETTNPANVLPCGSYTKGETQDYTVFFTRPAVDVGSNGLLFPQIGLCQNEAEQVTVGLRNYGTTPVSNIPVTTTIRGRNGIVAVLRGTFTGTIPAFGLADFTYEATFSARSSTEYTFTTRTALPNDANPSNDIYAISLRVSDPNPPPVATARICGTDATVLQGTGSGTIFWYDAPAGGNLLATGSPAFTTVKTPGNTYYAAFNEFEGRFGPQDKNVFLDGGYNQFSPAVNVRAHVPLVIESARLYIGHPGKIIFTLETLSGTPLSSVILNVEATRSPAAAGAQLNDPNDQGAVYDLNLVIPAAGDYRISIEYEDGATIFRNNEGVRGYPFTIPNVIAITGNTATATANTTPTSYYYYFYDLKVSAVGCPSERVAVTAGVSEKAEAVIIPQGPTSFCGEGSVLLQANTGPGLTYQWQKDGLDLLGVTADTLRAAATGRYSVVVTNQNGCSQISEAVRVEANPIPATPTITQQGRTLTSNAPAGNQWYRNGEIIAGANEVSYTPPQDGRYTVVVTLEGCASEPSDPFRFSQEDYSKAGDEITNLWIDPNPSPDGRFRVRFNVESSGPLELRFVNTIGQVIYRETAPDFTGSYENVIDLHKQGSGLYIMQLQYRNRVLVRKVVISH